MQIAYDKGQYNYLYRMCTYFIEQVKESEIKQKIGDFLNRIEDNCGWYQSEGYLKIVLNMSDSDVEVLLYVLENIVFYTIEARRIMNVCEDRFSYVKDRSFEGKNG